MKTLYRLGLVVTVLAVLGLAASWLVPANYATRARLIQRVKPSDPDLAALTGEVGAFIGPPELMIVEDPKAFLPGAGDEGALLVNDDYLRAHGLYPLQLKSVEAVARYGRVASIVAVVFGFATALLARRRLRAARAPGSPEAHASTSPLQAG